MSLPDVMFGLCAEIRKLMTNFLVIEYVSDSLNILDHILA